jgi:D-alanyl-D-alanine carboxypeptidase (penicillin-binding protein 5/6)
MKNNLLYLALLSFVFISTSALALSNNFEKIINIVYPQKNTKEYSPLPTLKDDAKFPILSAQSVMAVDLVSGVTLYEKDPNKALLPASTTKIVTALVAMDTYQPDQILKVGRVNVVGQKMGLYMGEEMKFIDLLSGLLIYSANDAAEVLANNHPGGRDLFIGLMNKKVKDLGLNNTHFSNPTGLDNGAQFSTTRDLAVVAKVAMQNPTFAQIVGTKEKTVKSVDGRFMHRLVNINRLLGEVPGVLGVKTGWTENARENLVTYVERGDRKVMTVVLGSSDRFGETKELIEWIFNNYTWEEVKPN